MKVVNFRTFAKVLCDIDDVLMDCNGLNIAQWNREHPEEKPITLGEITDWGKTGKRTDELLPFFGRVESDCYQKQVPYEGAREFLTELMTLGLDVYLCTSVPGAIAGFRMDQIHRFFPMISSDHVILCSDKQAIAKDFMLHIDDSPIHIANSRAKHVILWRKPWNAKMTGMPAVDNYSDALAFTRFLLRGDGENILKLRYGKASDLPPQLICLVGPSGSNKKEIRNLLCEEDGFERLESHNLGKASKLLKNGTLSEEGITEYTVYGGRVYGSSINDVKEILEAGNHCVFVTDISGAISYRRTLESYDPSGNVIWIYCDVPEVDRIGHILETSGSIEAKWRIHSAVYEQKNELLCDIVLDARDPEAAAEELLSLLKGKQ
ncbi:MAG: hypothetical protein J5825_11345 [Lachnospiraceae bacterium]|nr:hypothetical protein [Lachnospiraceae bacterium]